MHFNFPYPSQRMPLFARNAVATSQPLAAQAGLRMLLNGGNAVDAALAAAIALTVVEPTSNGLGSDAFAMVWDDDRLYGLNGSGRSPALWRFERFSELSEMPLLGWDSVTVPGAVDAWVSLSEKFGRLPFEDLFAPAAQYARAGFSVSHITAHRWQEAEDAYRGLPEFGRTFLTGGRAPRAGEVFRCEDQARTLEAIAESRGEAFYRGELAERIAACSKAEGGAMTPADLADHASEWVDPVSVEYRGLRLHEIPPNGQGLAALVALGVLRHFDLQAYLLDSADSIHLQIEAMKIAFAEVHRHVADPGFMEVTPGDLLDESFLERRAGEIHMDRAALPISTAKVGGGTVYLTAADESGMMVSFIQSNYWGFGSGVVVPGTGISLQNRGCGFNLKKGHPNCVDGGKRPYHTMIPAFVTRDGAPVMSFGVMGAHMQPQGHVQMMVRIFDYLQNPQTALDAPRWHVDEAFRVSLEAGFSAGAAAELERRGHRFMDDFDTSLFGGGQIVYRLEEGYCAASDPRKDGQAVGV
ncbi:MAG: gamma-glutamyltransferase family protein [Deltaproteobacteria bacterium]|nr:gamma-glutamyltransferase family protein [Deltaproteobacteria bacterium]